MSPTLLFDRKPSCVFGPNREHGVPKLLFRHRSTDVALKSLRKELASSFIPSVVEVFWLHCHHVLFVYEVSSVVNCRQWFVLP